MNFGETIWRSFPASRAGEALIFLLTCKRLAMASHDVGGGGETRALKIIVTPKALISSRREAAIAARRFQNRARHEGGR